MKTNVFFFISFMLIIGMNDLFAQVNGDPAPDKINSSIKIEANTKTSASRIDSNQQGTKKQPHDLKLTGSNLTPYQPSGWSDKIVLSTVSGTNTSSSTIYNNQTIYLDWAVINNGTSNITQTFYTKLYIDGTLVATYYTNGLTANYYTTILDAIISPLSAGTHTFKISTDANGNVFETNEGDNEYTITKTISSSVSANLTPYQPSGWSDKIVLSTVSGTNTSSSTIYDNQTIYLDWAVANNGSSDINQNFTTKLYIDGSMQGTYTTYGLASNYYTYINDDTFGPFTAGTYTFKIKTDANGDVSETNEGDNEYTITKTIFPSINANLTPYQPSGWSDKIVLSTVSGTNTSSSTIYDNQTIYLDWAVANNGSSDINQNFTTKLYIDGSMQGTYTTYGLASNYYTYINDDTFGPFTAGTYTFKIKTDANGDVSETNEGDNEYTITKTIFPSINANLTPYQPSGWSDKIVLSTVSGTNTSSSTIYDNQTIYLDWAVINNGTSNITQTFYTKLYIDGTLQGTYATNGLNSNYYTFLSDATFGPLSAGTHTFKISTDANGNVSETNEGDNEYTITKSIIQQATTPNIVVTPASITINQNNPSPFQNQNNFSDTTETFSPINPEDQNSNNQIHGRGLIVPDSVKIYWETHSSPELPPPPQNTMTTVDWSSQDSPVKNQQSCGSCWAFAAVALLENLGLQTDLSEQAVVSCNSAGNNCSGGWHWNALQYSQSIGVPPESCYPYTSGNGSCNSSCPNPPFRERVTSYTPSNGLWGETTTIANLKNILNNGPAIVTMIVPTNGTFDSYPGGIYNYSGGTIPWNGNAHAILCVGYDDIQQCFKVKNSWGQNWGESGYFRIAYDDVTDDVHFGGYAVQASGVYTQNLNGSNFTIQNTGTGTLTVTSINDNANWLTTSTSPAPPFTLAPGASQVVTPSVTWSQVSPPQQTATITVTSNDPDSPNYQVSVTAIPLTSCSISGTITDNTGSPISGVTITFSGTGGGITTTNSSGQYSFTVPSGYTGNVTPVKPCYTFNPTVRSYSSITGSQNAQNFTGTITLYTISGTITNSGSQGIAGVSVMFSGTGGGIITTNSAGLYSITLPCNYSGNATPALTGYIFSPGSRSYSNLASDYSGQNYSGITSQISITGTIMDASNNGIQGVNVTFSGSGGGSVLTNSNGQYTFLVSSGYSGTATPTKDCFIFAPTSRSFSNVTVTQSGQNFTGSIIGILGLTGPITGSNNICNGTSVFTYSVQPLAGATSYIWTLPYGATGNSTTNTIVVTFGNGAITGYITVKGHNACSDSPITSLLINVHQSPTVNAGNDQTISVGTSVTLTASGSGGTAPFSYQWNNGMNSQSILVTPLVTTNFSVTITDAYGCIGSDAVTINIIPPPSQLNTSVPIINTCAGSIIVPVTVNNFNGIAAISLTLPYNTSVLTYTGYQNANSALSSGMLLVNSNNGKVQIAWFSTTAATFGNGTLLELKFTAVIGSSTLNWDITTPGACQYSDINNVTIPSSYVNGNIVISSCSNLQGTVSYNNNVSTILKNTAVFLKQGSNIVSQTTTDMQGHYIFSNVATGTYTLDGVSTIPWEGVNSSDALLILKHFVGMVTLSGLRYQAADVDTSKFINSTDALFVAKRFVGLTNSFPSGNWLFNRDTVVFTNTGNITKNIQALCYGDVDGSNIPSSKIEPDITLQVTGTIHAEKDKDIEIPLTVLQVLNVGAVSLSLTIPSDGLTIKDVYSTNGGTLVYNIIGNELRIAWYTYEPVDLNIGDRLLIIKCQVNKNQENWASSWGVNPESLIADGNAITLPDIYLAIPDLRIEGLNYSLGQNIPNPFTTNSVIPYFLPEPGKVVLKIYDIMGNELRTLVNQTQEAGTYMATVESMNLPPSMYYYKFEVTGRSGYFSQTKQMIVGR